GAITQLRNKATGREWASEKNPIALFTYQTLSAEDYQRFMASYLTTKEDWAAKDFGKPNIERFGARSQEWQPASAEVRAETNDSGDRILIALQFEDEDAFNLGRAAFPRRAFIELELP